MFKADSITHRLLGSEQCVSIGFINLVIRLKNVTGILNEFLKVLVVVWFAIRMLQLYKIMHREIIMKSRSIVDEVESCRKLDNNKS